MRQRQRWTKEQKAEFWAAFVRHRDEGCNIREAWRRAYADFQAEGKLAPGLRTFANWYWAAMRPQREEAPANVDGPDGRRGNRRGGARSGEDDAAGAADLSDGSDSAEGEVEVQESDADPEEAAEEAAPDPDYTHRLELMVLLYRRRSDSDCDAVCDRLLPELTEEEE